MGERTSIAWTDHTFNPWWGCEKVSPGCANCYAESLARRWGHNIWGPGSERRVFGAKHWNEPVEWNRRYLESNRRRRERVFCGSMCDWCEDHPTVNRERPKLFELIRRTPVLNWLLLTKRADRIAECLADGRLGDASLPLNLWLGVTVESAEQAWRIQHLRNVAASVRFVSWEPALGDLAAVDLTGIDWVIFGGESGPGYRAPAGWADWARGMRDRCRREGRAFFFKQSPGIRTGMGEELDGRMVREFPM
jgi:protein gp37